MSPSTYTPKPGTTAYRILSWFERQPMGAEFTAGAIAGAIDIESGHLFTHIAPLVDHGYIERRTKHGAARPFFYRLASSPVEKPEVEPAKAAAPWPFKPRQIVREKVQLEPIVPVFLPADPPKASTVSEPEVIVSESFEIAPQQEMPPPEGAEAAQAPEPEEGEGHAEGRPEPAQEATRFAYWSTGELTIERPGHPTVELTSDETYALLEYLAEFAEDRG